MSSLDDFFAKKDRKKKGIKSGDGSKDRDNNKKDKPVDITDNFKYINDNGDEWLDFEENRDKDYSGLKIQALSIKDKEQILIESKAADLAEEALREGNVWSGKKAEAASSTVDEEVKEVEETKEVVEEVKKEPEVKKYIPPSLRSSQSEVPKRVVLKNKAPELESKSEFPTL